MISTDFLWAISFYSLILLFVYKNKSKFKREYGILFLYKTQKGLGIVRAIGKKVTPITKILTTLGIIVAIYFIIMIPILLAESSLKILSPGKAEQQFALLIPGVNLPGSPIYIPFWYGIISLALIVLVHEGGHALATVAEKIKLKNGGFGFLLFIPLFFVEPDEAQLKKRKEISRLRIGVAGSLANILTAIILALIINNILFPILQPHIELAGVQITSLKEDYPAYNSGIKINEVITQVDNTTTANITTFVKYLNSIKTGEPVVFTMSDKRQVTVLPTANPNNQSQAYLGISFQQKTKIKETSSQIYILLLYLLRLLNWASFLNIAVGIMNFTPVWLFDGGLITANIISAVIKNRAIALKITNAIYSTTLILLLFNIFGPLIF